MPQVAKAMLVTGDLFFSSQIEGVARSAGVTLDISSHLPDADGELGLDMLIVDLELAGLDCDELARLLHKHELPAVGYASHVKTHLFEAGKKAGIEHLVVRGGLRDRLRELFHER